MKSLLSIIVLLMVVPAGAIAQKKAQLGYSYGPPAEWKSGAILERFRKI